MSAYISWAVTVLGVVILAQTVLSVNKAPVWDEAAMNRLKDTFSRNVFENSTENKLLGVLKATDPENKQVTYGIDSENTVTVNEFTGEVRLARILDREKGDTRVDVRFLAFDPYETGSNVRNEIDYSMRLDVQDVNDNAPIFLGRPYGASVLENTPAFTTIFTKVKIQDLDDGYNAEVFIECLTRDEQSRLACEKFNVTSLQQPEQGNYTCSVFTKQTLDYEEQSSYILTLLAWDNGKPRLSNRVNIHVRVIDVQDTPPVFLNTPINLYTNESIPSGSVVGEIQARDGDQGNPRPVIIKINPGINDADLFRLEFKSVDKPVGPDQAVYTYNVITTQQLDRESLRGQAAFSVNAIEMDNGVETNVATTTTVLVNIFDVNDNPPSFDQDVYYINASESVRATDNTQIPGLTMTVTDRDDASNARFSVSIKSQTFPGAFAVSPSNATGQGPFALTVINADYMDYENPSYRQQTVVVVAKEVGTVELFSSSATVYVSLMDVNDNWPIFGQKEYNVTVNENEQRSFLTFVRATDADSGVNGNITYKIDTGTGSDISEFFSINPSMGFISMLGAVDYEQNREFPLVISASDGGSPVRTTKVVLRVIVRNVNDILPQFVVGSYETRVTETSTILQPAITVQATDTEEGTGNITYRIVSGNNLPNGPAFRIDRSTGLLSLTRTVNYNETPNRRGYFVLVIAASDNAALPQRPLESRTNVTINVQDENNFDARFDKLVYSASVSELATVGTNVIQVNATDDDRGENGRLTYSLQGSLGDFNINSGSGLIRVSPNAQLDSLARPLYRLTVVATDNGSPRQRSSSAIVNVNIVDKNNKAPSFTEALYTATVSEKEQIHSFVLQVRATDPDVNSSLVYTIREATIQAKDPKGAVFNNPGIFNYRASFYIDADDGEIHIQNKLSYEDVAEMDFAVEVRDVFAETPTPIQTATASVNIRILGSVDATPRFVAPWTVADPTYFFTIPEETSRNTLITTLVATDPIGARPIDNFREVTSVDEPDYFYVNPRTGELFVNNRLDYDTLTSHLLPLEVQAISNDRQKTAIARIRIHIQDINDNSPKFDKERYVFEVYENRVYPHLVGEVFASDDDSGDFAKLSYSIGGIGANNFQILSNGKVIVAVDGNLDRETKKVYELTVTATDNPEGRTQRQGSAQLSIRILDENDVRPQFSLGSYRLLTVDNIAVGTVIGGVEATDQDTGVNAQVVFTMLCQGKANNLFVMNLFNGEVSIDRALGGNTGTYQCTVTASDQGRPTLTSTVGLSIEVGASSNDLSPTFSWPPSNYTGTNVSENTAPGVLVGSVAASSPFGNVTYSFVENSDSDVLDSFSIDSQTGEVRTIAVLDREHVSSYELRIRARVVGNTTLTSVTTLRIAVQDQNDNMPRFDGNGCVEEIHKSPPYKLYPQEDTPVGTRLMLLSACDDDEAANTITNYTFVTREDSPDLPNLRPECVSQSKSLFRLKPVGDVKVAIEVAKSLDHDIDGGTKHLLCVRATDARPLVTGRRKRQSDFYDQQNYTVAYIEVMVVDINDNGPKFAVKVTREVILEFPSSDGLVTVVTATDADSAPYDRVRYSIQSSVFTARDGSNRNISIAFDIDSITGAVKTTLTQYTQFISGTFNIGIRAEDSLNNRFYDTTTLLVSVIQVGQRLSISWTIKNDQQGDASLKNGMQRNVQQAVNSKGWKVSVDELRYHVNNNGEKDSSKFDACFVVVDEKGHPPQKDEVEKAIREGLSLDGPYDIGLCDVETSAGLGGGSAYWWVLIALAIIIFIGTIILIIIVFILAARFVQKRDNMTTSLIQN